MTLPIFTRGQDKDLLKQILDKAKKPKTTAPTLKGGNSLINKIQNIQQLVQQRLGHYAEELQLIQTQEDLKTYIDKAIENGVIAIDTETTGLDPITDHIVGVCLYTPGLKSAYVPMYHISYITNLRLEKQLDNDVVGEQLQRVVDAKTHVIFFNAKFDIRMIRHSLGVYMEPFWDGFIAGKCLKEDEEEASLKYLWKKYCSDNKDAPHFTFDKMFKGLRFDLVPINTAYLYAAMDTKMTYELYKFQEPYLDVNDKKCQDLDMTRLAFVFHEIEMPIITVVCDIEDRGVHLNKGLAAELSKKYHELMDEQLSKFYEELTNYDDQINAYVATHPDTKIQTPLNIGSPAQLAELFYDILKVEPPDKRNPRGTGEDILKAMKHPLCELILQYRGTQKLLSTYIDKLPEELNPKTHKIHCGFHQYGAATGRFACIAEGTKISILGGFKNIEDMESGDLVYSYTSEGKIELNKVKNKWFTGIRECVKLHWVSNTDDSVHGELICTPDHFIKTTDGWIMPKDLQPNHCIYGLPYMYNVTSIEYLSGVRNVYDIEVENSHCYIANELCVHNSSNPNLQNIPSHVKEIRTLFISEREYSTKTDDKCNLFLLWGDVLDTPNGRKFIMDLSIGDKLLFDKTEYIITNIQFDGNLKYIITLNKQINNKVKIHRLYCLFGGDFSQQEPKLTADLSNDEKFIAECAAGKDAYGTVASLAFNKPYEECLEFYLDENGKKTDRINKEGKERRTQSKSILLGICYGRTIKTIAEQLGCSEEKATQINDAVLNGIAGLRHLMDESQDMAKRCGFVETKWGRRRHIPDMQLEPFEVIPQGTKAFDPFFDSKELGVIDDAEQLRLSYIEQLNKAKYKQQKESIKQKAEKDGFKVKENTRKIEDAKRQCVNSRIQGSAADQCKIAIKNVAKDKKLKELDFHMVLLVHDEIIGEAPLVNITQVAPIFQQCLLDSAKDLRTGAKCDCTAVLYWYADQYEDEIHINELTKEKMREIIQNAPFIFEGDL